VAFGGHCANHLPIAGTALLDWRSESVEVEIAGSKVSIQHASEEVRKLINDLQDRLIELERPDGDLNQPAIPIAATTERSILWVDDRVDANVYERARLRDAGYQVVQAESTISAIRAIEQRGPFDLIVSDMARIETGGRLNLRAGLDLLASVRQSGLNLRVIYYSSARSLTSVQSELDSDPDVSYTTSPTELMRLIGLV
jgi:CheY-like chemotaxis protein